MLFGYSELPGIMISTGFFKWFQYATFFCEHLELSILLRVLHLFAQDWINLTFFLVALFKTSFISHLLCLFSYLLLVSLTNSLPYFAVVSKNQLFNVCLSLVVSKFQLPWSQTLNSDFCYLRFFFLNCMFNLLIIPLSSLLI